MAPMNELRRLAYLEAMDIPNFVSRADLPGALPSNRLRAVRLSHVPVTAKSPGELLRGEAALDFDTAATAERPAAGKPGLSAALASPNVNSPNLGRSNPGPGETAATAASDVSTVATPSSDVPVFTVLATEAGGWLWLDEIPAGRDPGAAHTALIAAIAAALGLDDRPPSPQFFNYPVAAGTALAGGIAGARDAFYGFVSGRIARMQPGRVVLLGDWQQEWFDASSLEGPELTRTVSVFAMLRDPALKAQAWRDLAPLASQQ